MRHTLDTLYRLSGAIAAGFLCAIALVVLAQVLANAANYLGAALLGVRFGLLVPAYSDFAGFFLASATFFALSYTLRMGGHIRVTLVIGALPARIRHIVEGWCLLVAGGISIYFTVYVVLLTLESWEFGDRSIGMVSIPIWIPQTGMALGLVVLSIALVDEFVSVLRGRKPSYEERSGESLIQAPETPKGH